MSWFKFKKQDKIKTQVDGPKKKGVPQGVWDKCPSCEAVLYRPELKKLMFVCPKCDYHMRISARQRIDFFLDTNNRKELGRAIKPVDILKFKDTKLYKDRLSASQKKTGENDALIAMAGEVNKIPVITAIFEFAFQGGSMGSVVGHKFVLAANYALEHRIPLICFTASGGARMQESLYSLMQMAKVSAVLAKLKTAGIPYIVVLTDPTTGGVSASLAMLGDIQIAEPKALIGFAGPKVIEQTVREKLPEGFQRSEFLQEKGMVDMIIKRADLRATISRLLIKLMQLPVNGNRKKTQS